MKFSIVMSFAAVIFISAFSNPLHAMSKPKPSCSWIVYNQSVSCPSELGGGSYQCDVRGLLGLEWWSCNGS
jgi:hypothetical protein